MEKYDEIVKKAAERAVQNSLPYTGALLPTEANALLKMVPKAKLIDVRTQAEWDWVGRVPEAVQIEWNQWPGGTRNPAFAQTLKEKVPDLDTPLLFLCRSGVRSHAAATLAKELGYATTFNVLGGFEGDKDDQGHRNTVNGWRASGLPWSQS